ncbi:MAG: tripartite tricarboxylate transporter substrate binding protein [Betaproteobacteria bacterium]|nr:tripartite tricarboxylate transporter substrate binding protein [Betaproteobacteria bacterium]
MSSWRLPARVLPAVMMAANAAWAQDYPNRVVRIIVPGTGNFFDIAARLYAQELSGPLGQQVIVDNRANGIVAAEVTAKAPPDGHTLLISTGSLWLAPFIQPSVSFDPVRDYAPITMTTRSPLVLVVHPSLPVASVRDLIRLAKARPGALNYAIPTVGSTGHLAVELFKSMAGIDIVQVGYRSSGPATIDLMAGQVQLMFSVTGGVAQHVKTGRLKALAVSTAQPTALVPGVPTVAESGLPGFSIVSTAGMLAPANTPAAVINRLNQEFVRVLTKPELKERLFNLGVEAINSSPAEFAAFIKAEMAKMGKVIKDAGIRTE